MLQKLHEEATPAVFLEVSSTRALVDTAAGQAIMGTAQRLMEALKNYGLKAIWVTPSTPPRSHGIGGKAKVVGVLLVPTGIEGVNGVVEFLSLIHI